MLRFLVLPVSLTAVVLTVLPPATRIDGAAGPDPKRLTAEREADQRGVRAWAKGKARGEPDPEEITSAVTLYASFDEEVRADHGGGELTPDRRFDDPTGKGAYTVTKGVDPELFRIAKGKGISGGALEVVDLLPNRGRMFFPAKGNLAYKQGGWGGSLAVWCNTDPDKLLKTGFSDPVQITQEGPTNGGLWVDFNDTTPRGLRHGAFPVIRGKKIEEDDPAAPIVRVPDVGWKAGDWHHVVVTWENLDTGRANAATALYIDGKLMGEVKGRALDMDWDVEKTGIYLAIDYIGLLDEFALFGRALTPDEVKALHGTPALLSTLKRPAKK